MAADHFAILAAALCAAGQSMVERLEKLESDEIALKTVKGSSVWEFSSIFKQRSNRCGSETGEETIDFARWS